MKQILESTPEMGTVSIRTNRLDLNSHQVYRTYKQRQAIEQFFRTYGAGMDFDASWNWDVGAEFRISIKKPGLQGLRP